MDLKHRSFDNQEINALKRNGFGQERGFNHLSIKVAEPVSEDVPVSLFKYDDFSPMVDTFMNSAAAIPEDNQFPSPTPTPTFTNFVKTQQQHPLSQVINQSDINLVTELSTATTPTNPNFGNLLSPTFSSWPYTSPISPAFPTGLSDFCSNNSMINTPNRLAMEPMYTSMHLPSTLSYNLEKNEPNTPINPENFASLTANTTSFLLQSPGFANGSPSPQTVPDQLSPIVSSALVSPTTETSPNMLYVPWEVGLLDPQSGMIDFSAPQAPPKFEIHKLSDKPSASAQSKFENNHKFMAPGSPTAESFKPSNSNASDGTQLYTCTYPNCKKIFSCIYNLRSHYRIHSTERPFKCESCQQSFSRNHDLKRHQKIHLGIKPYRCAKCDRTFGRLDALKRHTLVKRCAEKASKEKSGLTYSEASNVTVTSFNASPGQSS